MSLLYGLAAAIAIWWLIKAFGAANPKVLAKTFKAIGGTVALGFAGLLFMRGRLDMAMFLGGVGAWLLGWTAWGSGPFRMPPWMTGTQTTPGGGSAVRSKLLAMDLDHDSGAIRGKVIAGAFAGRDLDSLDKTELGSLLRACLADDADGARLLEAYLDRRTPGWREDADPHHHPGQGGNARPGAMAEQEAYEILGLQPGATGEAIRAAHRSLMKRLHPDAGGTSSLAARVNEAKDVLLKRHG